MTTHTEADLRAGLADLADGLGHDFDPHPVLLATTRAQAAPTPRSPWRRPILAVAALAAILVVFTLLTNSLSRPSNPSGTPSPLPDVAGLVTLSEGGTAIVRQGNTVLLSTDAGGTWRPLGLPADLTLLRDGHPVATSGTMLVAVARTNGDLRGSLVLASSFNGGRTWGRDTLGDSGDVGTVEVALGPNGLVAVVGASPGSSGINHPGGVWARTLLDDFGGTSRKSAPVSGMPAWVGDRLILVGGPTRSALYTSDDLGHTWTQRPVLGSLAPTSDIPADSPVIGRPATFGSQIVLPVLARQHGQAYLVRATTSDGSTVQSGRGWPVDPSPPPLTPLVTAIINDGLIALPASSVTRSLIIVSADGYQLRTTTGLPSTPTDLTFADARVGLTAVPDPRCEQASCAEGRVLYRTTDGGVTWSGVVVDPQRVATTARATDSSAPQPPPAVVPTPTSSADITRFATEYLNQYLTAWRTQGLEVASRAYLDPTMYNNDDPPMPALLSADVDQVHPNGTGFGDTFQVMANLNLRFATSEPAAAFHNGINTRFVTFKRVPGMSTYLMTFATGP